MKTRVAINGFGRTGRNVFKVLFDRSDIEVVALNDLMNSATLSHLLKYDTVYGRYAHDVSFSEDSITVGDTKIQVLSEREPAKLPWKDLNIDVVIESTGFFVEPAKARAHIEAGAKRVIISAPAKGDSADDAHTIVLGVNDDSLENSESEILSNASCTTNCISPVMSIIQNEFGIDKAMMTTIHSYTAGQNLQDGAHKDLRRARAAALNIIPTSTGATIAAGKVIPELVGNFDGMAIRVPTAVGSLSDFVIITKQPVTVESVNEAFRAAAKQPYYQGILAVTEDPLVSSDIVGNSHSAIVDLNLTKVTGDNMLKIVAWYDNEWGYSNRLAELVADTGKLLQSE